MITAKGCEQLAHCSRLFRSMEFPF